MPSRKKKQSFLADKKVRLFIVGALLLIIPQMISLLYFPDYQQDILKGIITTASSTGAIILISMVTAYVFKISVYPTKSK